MAYVVTFNAKSIKDWTNKALVRLIQLAAVYTEREARLGVPKDTSALARSIVAEAKGLTATVYSPLVYASVMEEGRTPGATMPPPAALQGWINRHGFQGSPYVLARAIGRRGIKGRFYFQHAVQMLEKNINTLAQQALKETQ